LAMKSWKHFDALTKFAILADAPTAWISTAVASPRRTKATRPGLGGAIDAGVRLASGIERDSDAPDRGSAAPGGTETTATEPDNMRPKINFLIEVEMAGLAVLIQHKARRERLSYGSRERR
jgi:hypothetical protein